MPWHVDDPHDALLTQVTQVAAARVGPPAVSADTMISAASAVAATPRARLMNVASTGTWGSSAHGG